MIGLASDHKGYKIKQNLINYLTESGYNIIDYGTNSEESADYPTYAFKVGEAIKNKEIKFGILICGTGIGMSIAINKVKCVRCAKVDNINEASLARLHNDANAIAISAENEHYIEIIEKFLTTEFSNINRHLKRIEMVNNYDN